MDIENIISVHTGKLWKNESFYLTFKEADNKRNKLIKIWDQDEKHKGMQVKVKWMSSKNKFVVKTRLHPDFDIKIKENKKSGKNRKRNKKNSGGGMFDPTTSI